MSCFFFFNDTATTEIYTLSLHDALPICFQHRKGSPAVRGRGKHQDVRPREHGLQDNVPRRFVQPLDSWVTKVLWHVRHARDRKSTRLNSSHANISYAVFCLKKKQMACFP